MTLPYRVIDIDYDGNETTEFAITLNNVQLLGVTCLHLAGEFSFLYTDPTGLGDFVMITDNSYTREQIQEWTNNLLIAMKYTFEETMPLDYIDQPNTIIYLFLVIATIQGLSFTHTPEELALWAKRNSLGYTTQPKPERSKVLSSIWDEIDNIRQVGK